MFLKSCLKANMHCVAVLWLGHNVNIVLYTKHVLPEYTDPDPPRT